MSISIVSTYRGLDPRGTTRYQLLPGGRESRALHRVESAVVASLVIAGTLGVWWWTSTAATPPPVVEVTSPATPAVTEGRRVAVHVAGEVVAPGVVILPSGSRVVDAVRAAGGATARADLSSLNLAAELVDGAQVLVPGGTPRPGPVGTDDGVVVLNRATAGELESLPGVGPVLAARIVDHRDRYGPFATVEDLLDVSGIGESILERLRGHVRVP